MEQQGDGDAEGPTHGCMQCKARQRYTVEELRNRNTLWRCAVCGYVVNLIPGAVYRRHGGEWKRGLRLPQRPRVIASS